MVDELNPAQDPFSELSLTPEQRQMVDLFAQMGHKRLGISPVPWRGFVWKAVRAWQQKHRSHLESLADASPEERWKHAKELKEIFLSLILAASPEHRHPDIRSVVEDGLATYEASFNRR